jgi:hypothetical protein
VISPAPPSGASAPCAQQVPVGGSPVPVSAVVGGLSPSTTYTVRLVATSQAGQSSGAPVKFTMPAPAPLISRLKVRGNTITLTLSQRARLTFTFARRDGKKYVVLRGSVSARGVRGTNRIRLRDRSLKAGSYRLTAIATNSGGESSSPVRARFVLT